LRNRKTLILSAVGSHFPARRNGHIAFWFCKTANSCVEIDAGNRIIAIIKDGKQEPLCRITAESIYSGILIEDVSGLAGVADSSAAAHSTINTRQAYEVSRKVNLRPGPLFQFSAH